MNTSFSVIYTVKNEQLFLGKAIEYYKALGAKKIFIFWDNTTDNAPELVKDNPLIFSRKTIQPDEFECLFGHDYPEWFNNFLDMWEIKHNYRKRVNTMYAAMLSKELGIEWMICPDPDELVYFPDKESFNAETFEHFLASVKPSIDQILLRNMESVPTKVCEEHPFTDVTYFVNRFPKSEFFIQAVKAILRLMKIPKAFIDKIDHHFFRLRFKCDYPKAIINPINGQKVSRSLFMGYRGTKSIIRVREAQNYIFNIHKWESYAKRLKSIQTGYILHYDLCTSESFKNKFKQRHTDVLDQGFNNRATLAKIAVELDNQALSDFFEDQMMISNPATVERLIQRGILSRIDKISDFYSNRRNDQ